MKVLYLDQVGGVSGDMFLAALVDLGADVRALEEAVRGLGLPDVRLSTRAVTRAGLDALHLQVDWDGRPGGPSTIVDPVGGHAQAPEARGTHHPHGHHHHDHHHDHPHDHHPHQHHHDHDAHPDPADDHAHPHRGYAEIVRMIRGSTLSPRVQEMAERVFLRLGEAEADVHGIPLESVHFHEVGAVDSIVDIVGVCWALDALGIEQVHSSPFVFGRGDVRMAHGRWPVPAPATLRLTEGFPVEMRAVPGETVTPTGAALVTALAAGVGAPLSMRLLRTGVGAGSRDAAERPNVLRALLGEVESGRESVEILETAIDDMSPQRLARLAALLFEAGALDVWTTPAVMKKGRSGHLLTALALLGEGAPLEDLIFAESTTLGIRRRREERRVLPRRIGTVTTPWGSVRVKIAELPGDGVRVTPEFDDCQHLAVDTGLPLDEIIETARRARVDIPPEP